MFRSSEEFLCHGCLLSREGNSFSLVLRKVFNMKHIWIDIISDIYLMKKRKELLVLRTVLTPLEKI